MKTVAPGHKWGVGDKFEPGSYSTDQGSTRLDYRYPRNQLTFLGNVSHVVPSFHGLYAIPIKDNAANHTPGFTDAAATKESHELTILTSKGMAGVGLRLLLDDVFAAEVKGSFKAGD